MKIVVDDQAVRIVVRDRVARDVVEHFSSDHYLDLVGSLVKSLRMVYPDLKRDDVYKFIIEQQCAALRLVADKTEERSAEMLVQWRERNP